MDGSLADSGSYFTTDIDWGTDNELQVIDQTMINKFSDQVSPVSESFEIDGVEPSTDFKPTSLERMADAVMSLNDQKVGARDRVQDVVMELSNMSDDPSLHKNVSPELQPMLDSMQSSMNKYFDFQAKFHDASMEYRTVSDVNSWMSTISQSIVSLVKNIITNTR